MGKFKKLAIFGMAMACTAMGLVGCNCNKEESSEAKYIRLYDLNGNAVVDEWEKPYNYGDNYNGVHFSSRTMTDNDGLSIANANRYVVSNDSDLGGIANAREQSTFANTVVEFKNGTFFKRNDEQKLACRGARAYIVHVSSASELINFAKYNLTNPDSDKYIVVLDSDINFRASGYENASEAYSQFTTIETINLNGASLYGNGHTIEGFRLTANTMQEYYSKVKGEEVTGKYDTISSDGINNYVNLKYSLIANASAVYDLNIHVGYDNIVVDPLTGVDRPELNMLIDVAPLRNVAVIDNVATRGKMDVTTKVYKSGDVSDNNTNISVVKINISALTVDQDDICDVVAKGDSYSVVSEGAEKDDSKKYDYDRLITTTYTEKANTEDPTKTEYVPQFTYSDKIVNVSTSNVVSEMWLNYAEAVRDEHEGDYYDSADEINIGSVSASAMSEGKVVRSIESTMDVNLTTGSNINMGAIATTSNRSLSESITNIAKYNITSIGKSNNNIGGIVGNNVAGGEIKNATATIDDGIIFKGSIDKDENNIETKQSRLAIGGIAGVNSGLIVASKAVGSWNVSDCLLAISGAIAGAGYNGLYIKDLSDITATIDNCDHVYSATLVGSTIGGMINSCIAKYTADITATRQDNNAMAQGDNKLVSPALVSVGLLYFQSQYYMDVLSDEIQASAKYDNLYKLQTSNNTRLGEVLVPTNFAPKCVTSMVIDNTSLNIKDVEKEVVDGDYEPVEEKKSDMYVGEHVNLGGYHIYRFMSSEQNAMIAKYEKAYNLHFYGSSFKINGTDKICVREVDVTDPETKEVTTTHTPANLFSVEGARLAYMQEFNIGSLKNTVGFNGINKNGVTEISLIDNTKEFSIRNIAINNIHTGSYFAPDDYTDLQMDTNIYADLDIDTYEEYQRVMDIYLDSLLDNGSQFSKLTRQDMFKVMMVRFNLFSTDSDNNIGYRDLINTGNTQPGQVYKKNEDGSLATETDYINSKPSSATNAISIMQDKLYFGIANNDASSNPTIYVFKKESLTPSTEGDNIVYHLPDGFVDIRAEEQKKINSLNAVEILTIYRLSQIRGYKYIAINIDPNLQQSGTAEYQPEEKPYSRLGIVTYEKVGDEDEVSKVVTYILDTYVDLQGNNGVALFYNITNSGDTSTTSESVQETTNE